jgi:hypothetical protein
LIVQDRFCVSVLAAASPAIVMKPSITSMPVLTFHFWWFIRSLLHCLLVNSRIRERRPRRREVTTPDRVRTAFRCAKLTVLVSLLPIAALPCAMRVARFTAAIETLQGVTLQRATLQLRRGQFVAACNARHNGFEVQDACASRSGVADSCPRNGMSASADNSRPCIAAALQIGGSRAFPPGCRPRASSARLKN